jgi:hypothetical protein
MNSYQEMDREAINGAYNNIAAIDRELTSWLLWRFRCKRWCGGPIQRPLHSQSRDMWPYICCAIPFFMNRLGG